MRKKKILLSWAAFLLLAVGVLWCYSSRNQESKMIPLPEGGKVVEPSLGGSTPQPLPVKPLDLSPEAIANWSVCRNEKYGYEFKYPKGWYIQGTHTGSAPEVRGVILCERGMNITISKTLPPTIITIDTPRVPSFSFSATNKEDRARLGYPEIKSVDDWYQAPLKITPYISPVQKETKIDSERALWIGEGEKGVIGDYVMLFHKGTTFEVSFSGLGTEFRESIVSTFKFID